MGNNIKGITVEIGGNTAPLEKALKDVNKTSKDLQSELRQVEKQLKFDPGNTTLLAQQQKLLAESVTSTKEKLETLKEAEKQVEGQFKQGKIGEEQYRALQREVIKTEQDLERLEGKLKSSNSALEAFCKKAKEAGEELNGIGEGVKGAGEKMATGITAPIVAAGAVMIKGAIDAETAQGKLQASLGLTKEEANKLGEIAKEVWESGFGENIGEATTAITTVRQNMKGLSQSELADVTKGAMTIADVFDEDVNAVTAAAGVMMKNFGIDGTHALDVITVGFQQGGNYSGELLDTMREYAPQFKSLGIEADQAMGMLIAGAEAGAFNLDKVGDSMKEFNIRAQDGSKTTAQGFESIGLNADEMGKAIAQGGNKAQGAFMATVTALAGMKDPMQQNQAGVALFGTQWEDVRSNVIIAMKDGMNGIGEFTGETKAATDAISKSNPGIALRSALREVQSAVAPVLQPVINFITSILIPAIKSAADGFANLSPSVQKAILVIVGIAVAIGPVIIVIGNLISAFGTIAGVVAGVSATIAEAGGIIALLTNPIGIVIAAIIGFIAIFTILYNTNKEFRSNVNTVWQQIQSTIGSIIENVKTIISVFVQVAKDIWHKYGNDIVNVAKTAFNLISSVVQTSLDLVSNIIKIVTGVISGNWSQVWEGIKGVISTIWNGIGEIVKNYIELVKSIISAGLEIAWDNVKRIFNGIKEAIISPIRVAVDFVKEQVDKIKGFFSNLHIELPHIKLPHFNLTGEFSLEKMTVPPLAVDWYAKGGIFNSPSVIGVGEAGQEAVLPINKLDELMASAIKKAMGVNNISNNEPITIVVPVTLDGQTIAQVIAPYNDKTQGNNLKLASRGVCI